MGQQQSAFVVEIASSKYGNFQSVPQSDPDEEDEAENQLHWRITVNPSANFLSHSEELQNLIQRLNRNQNLISISEARYLCAGLEFLDITSELLLPLFTVISNATAYPSNQKMFLQCGLVHKLASMLKSLYITLPKSLRIMLLQCIANMAIHDENKSLLEPVIPCIIKRLDSDVNLESTVAFQALTNLATNITKTQLEIFQPTIQLCFKKLWLKGEVNLSSMRLLVNLTCCPDMVPYILAAKAVTGLLSVLDSDREPVILRAVTWLLCLSSTIEALSITYELIAPLNLDPFANPNYTVFFAIYSSKNREELTKRLQQVSLKNQEIVEKIDLLQKALERIPEARVIHSSLNRL